jgi:hypothetical protein
MLFVMRAAVFCALALAGLALASAQQQLVLRDDSSALYIDENLRIIDLVDTQLSLRAFLDPLDDWWSADYVLKNSNGMHSTLSPSHRLRLPELPPGTHSVSSSQTGCTHSWVQMSATRGDFPSFPPLNCIAKVSHFTHFESSSILVLVPYWRSSFRC